MGRGSLAWALFPLESSCYWKGPRRSRVRPGDLGDVSSDVEQAVGRGQPAQVVGGGRAVAGDRAAVGVINAAPELPLAAGRGHASASAAVRRGRCAGSPIAARRAGRMNTSKDTSALTGLPAG